MNIQMSKALTKLLEEREKLVNVCKSRCSESSFTVDDYRLTLAILDADAYLFDLIRRLQNIHL